MLEYIIGYQKPTTITELLRKLEVVHFDELKKSYGQIPPEKILEILE